MTANSHRGVFQFKAALSVLKFARALELSTDRLAAFGHLFREHLLADLSALTMPGQNSAKSLSFGRTTFHLESSMPWKNWRCTSPRSPA